jgi:hypothetical protein
MTHTARSCSIVALLGAFACAAACGRTGLGIEDFDSLEGDGLDASFDSATDSGTEASELDQFVPRPDSDPPDPHQCIPVDETCNGVDDDCNGRVDEVAAVPCPGGGSRYCVAGRLSECPKRCETCMPGSERVCFLSYCKFWANQACTADGRGFGPCHEDDPPPECRKVAKDKQYSRELEQCCIDNGYCCVDAFDLDNDGKKGEMIGRCDEVACTE